MKKLIRCTLIVFLTHAVACSASEGTSSNEMADEGYKRYRVESGIVEYEMTGAQTGKETLYFDQWGMREAKYTDTTLSVMGITQKTHQMSLLDGQWQYTIDLQKKTGTRIKNPLFQEMADRAGTKDLTELGERMINQMGEKVGTGQVAGKLCDIWQIKSVGTKTWVWNGITLKTQTNMAGMQIMRAATRIEEGASIPEDKFTIPEGVTITEGTDINKALEMMRKGKK